MASPCFDFHTSFERDRIGAALRREEQLAHDCFGCDGILGSQRFQ